MTQLHAIKAQADAVYAHVCNARQDEVVDKNCDSCSPSSPVPHTASHHFWRLPRVLVVHIKRFMPLQQQLPAPALLAPAAQPPPSAPGQGVQREQTKEGSMPAPSAPGSMEDEAEAPAPPAGGESSGAPTPPLRDSLTPGTPPPQSALAPAAAPQQQREATPPAPYYYAKVGLASAMLCRLRHVVRNRVCNGIFRLRPSLVPTIPTQATPRSAPCHGAHRCTRRWRWSRDWTWRATATGARGRTCTCWRACLRPHVSACRIRLCVCGDGGVGEAAGRPWDCRAVCAEAGCGRGGDRATGWCESWKAAAGPGLRGVRYRVLPLYS